MVVMMCIVDVCFVCVEVGVVVGFIVCVVDAL